MEILHTYKNGNTNVIIYFDGTKVRSFEGEPKPEFPESIDIKITNKCNLNCNFCHERSSIEGSHADLDKLIEVLKPLPAGVEISVGGGNILLHPNLIPFLEKAKYQGLISNITINQKHIKYNNDFLLRLINNKLVYGVGISLPPGESIIECLPIMEVSDNSVFHLIAGINSASAIPRLLESCSYYNKKCKILILGYKKYGFGTDYYKDNQSSIDENLYQWYIKIGSYLKKDNLTLSFDNLALSQLNIKRFLTNQIWDTFYMGEDGTFSMYIDAVKQEYSRSSTSNNRVFFNNISLLDYFSSLRI